MRRALAVLVVVGCGAAPVELYRLDGLTYVGFQRGEPPPLPELASDAERDAYLDNVMRDTIEQTGATGASLAIVREGEIAHAAGFGTTHEGGEAVDADTLFRIGSTGKLFTAAALLHAAEAGALDLDAPIDMAGLDPRITLRMLLSHQAGVADAGGCEEGLDTPSDYARAHAGDALWSPPGALWNYSNAGFALSAAALEAATGTAMAEYVETEILRPAGMEYATYDPERAARRPHAIGHRPNGELAVDEPPCGLVMAAGGAYASARELARFAMAMMADEPPFLSVQSRDAMLTSMVSMHGLDSPEAYGLGVMIREHHGSVAYHHGGGMMGWSSMLVWVPEKRFAAVALYNSAQVPPPHGLVTSFFPASRPPLEPLDESVRAQLAGVYRDNVGLVGTIRVELTEEGIRLVPLGGQAMWPLPVAITFWPNAEGRVTFLATRMGVATRTDS